MAAPTHHLLFIGTYTRQGSRGIYRLRLDAKTGALSPPELAAETGNPTFLALSPDRKCLYAVRDSEAMAAAFSVDGASGRLTPLPAAPAAPHGAPCYVAADRTGRVLTLAQYHDGVVATVPVRPDGTLGPPRRIQHSGHGTDPKRQEGPHVHSARISPDNRFVLVCDLGLDRIFTYRLDPEQAALAPGDPPFTAVAPASGPRHSAFSPDSTRLYVSNEIANTVSVYSYVTARGALAHRQTLSTLPAGWTGQNTAAEVLVHPGGRFLYVSNRGHDSVARFGIEAASGELAPLGFVPSGGRTPRGMGMSADGAWLVCAHQDSGTVTSFRLDPATGRPDPAGGPVAIPSAVAVLFYD